MYQALEEKERANPWLVFEDYWEAPRLERLRVGAVICHCSKVTGQTGRIFGR